MKYEISTTILKSLLKSNAKNDVSLEESLLGHFEYKVST